MGVEVSSMCSCFDKIQESKQEASFLAPNNYIDQPIDYQAVNQINGFEYEPIFRYLKPATERFKELIEEGSVGYDTIVDKENCKVYSKEASEGYVLKYTWNIPYSAADLMEFLENTDLRKTWDTNIETIQAIGSFSEKESIVYTKYKKFLTFDPRDTLAYTKKIIMNGNPADLTFSVESEAFPTSSNCVRVKLFVAGLYTEPIDPDDQGNITRITCLSHMDVGLPKAFNNAARKFAGTTIPTVCKKMSTAIKKYIDNRNYV